MYAKFVVGLLTLFLALLVISAPDIATAEEEKTNIVEAKKHFKAGQAFMQMERYDEAIVEFKKAYEITKDGLVMGQVAIAYEKAGDYEAALKAITIYRESLDVEEQKPANTLIKKYKKLISEGKSKKLVLSEEKPKEDIAQDQGETSIEATDVDSDTGTRKGRFYTWIATGAAGALALSALIVGLNAQSRYDELADTCKPACANDDVDSVKTRAIVADVLWGTTAAAAITAGVLFYLEGRSLAEEKRDPLEGDDDYDESEEFSTSRIHFTPVVGGGSYGISADIRF